MDVLQLFPYLVGLLNRIMIKAIAALPSNRGTKLNQEAWECTLPQL
jgi:hypothetical protein